MDSTPNTPSWNDISFVSVNTNGLKGNGHLLVEHILQRHSVSCIQESKLSDRNHLEVFQFHVNHAFTAKLFVSDHGAGLVRPTAIRRNGVITIVRSDFPGYDSITAMEDMTVEGRYLVVRTEAGGSPIYIHNVYAPVDATSKAEFFDGLPTARFEDDAIHVVLGDLNTPLIPEMDASRGTTTNDRGRWSCLAWLSRIGVVDPWRIHHPNEHVFTGPPPRKNRLDYILTSKGFMEQFYGDAVYFMPNAAGDHLAHRLVLRTTEQLHGKGYWRFPCHFLEYPDIVKAIQHEANEVLTQLRTATDPGSVWERWKSTIRRQLQAIQRKLRLQQNAQVEVARLALDRAAAGYRTRRDPNSHEVFQSALAEFKECLRRTSRYNQDASFDYQVKHAERSSKFFFRPKDPALHRVSIESVVTNDGSVSTNPQAISLCFRQHWGAVMGDEDSTADVSLPVDEECQERLVQTLQRRLDDSAQEALCAPLIAEDFAAALKHMKPNAAPGMDGLTAGFYRVAPEVFGECLAIVFNHQLSVGELLHSQRKSAVSLLHKKGSRDLPGNYRPISLIPVDTKALSKVLTFRLQRCIPSLIHQDQKAFIKGRSLHHHVRFLRDLQDLTTSRDEDGFAVFLDFEKAYDRVNWAYMFRTLERIGCGTQFLRWVKLLYTKPAAHLMINGHVQDPLYPTRGVKQGDPLSALLFTLVIEPLGNLLREHEEYGIPITDDHTATGVFFADDSTLLAGGLNHVQAQLELVEVYCAGSGAKLNLNKSTILPLHRQRRYLALPGLKILQPTEQVKYLGIPFSQCSTVDDTLEYLEQRLFDGLRHWHARARTLRGRILLVNTMVISRLWHYTMHVVVPMATVRRWQAAIHRFVLSRKYEKTARHLQLIANEFLQLSRSCGGLQIPNIDASIKRQRLQLVLQFQETALTPSRNWAIPGRELLRQVQPQFGPTRWYDIFAPTTSRHGDRVDWNTLDPWWKSAIHTWRGVEWDVHWHNLPETRRSERGLQQPIWFNSDPRFCYECPSRDSSEPGTRRRCLGMIAEPQRQFRKHFAVTFGVRCLGDFLQADHTWPSQRRFAERHIDYTAVEWTPMQQLVWLCSLHREATQVLARLELSYGMPFDRAPTFPIVVGVQHGTKTFYAPRIPRKMLFQLVWKPPERLRPHPLTFEDPATSDDDIQRFSEHCARLRSLVLPVFEDLQFRLAYGLLPTRSRFWFLQGSDPSAIQCIRSNCTAIETPRHLFLECTHASQLWQVVLSDFDALLANRPAWKDIAVAHDPTVAHGWRQHASIVGDVWHVTRAIVLRFLWMDRNRCLFDHQEATPTHAAVGIVYMTLAAHVRHLFRRCYEARERSSLSMVLQALCMRGHLGAFSAAHPGVFKIRFL